VVVVVEPGRGRVDGVGGVVVVVDGVGVQPGNVTRQSARAARVPTFAPMTNSTAVRPASVRILTFVVTVTCSVTYRKGLRGND
jgi:hypothetical protein